MTTRDLIDIEPLLVSIRAESPSGDSLLNAPEYDAVRQARRWVDDNGPQGDWGWKPKPTDWGRVIRLGCELLRQKTKDLRLAAWVAEALTRLDGFAGLHVGLRLVREIQDRFWDSYHPAIEDGDPESRHGPFLFLDAALPVLIRSLPLTSGLGPEPYCFLKWRESRETDNVGLKSKSEMEALVADGKITSKDFDDQVTQTPHDFYETLHENLTLSLRALKELDRSNEEHFGNHAPGLGSVREAIEDCLAVVSPILDPQRIEDDDKDCVELELVGQVNRRHVAPPRTVGPIADTNDAYRRIVNAAAYLRRTDPNSPVAYLIVRSLQSGRMYGLAEVSLADPPSSETRRALRQLAAEENWTGLLEQAELALARPEGLAWLDAQREAIRAMAGLGDEYALAQAACRSFLRMILTDFPGLAAAELGDGTSAASIDTQDWLRTELLAEVPGKTPVRESAATLEAEPTPMRAASDGKDPWDEARIAICERRADDGLAILRRALVAAVTGRDRFIRMLQLSEVCVALKRFRVALPLAEELARQVDTYQLEQWEDRELCARVWALLHECLRDGGGDGDASERCRRVFGRLCRLDAEQALVRDTAG